MKTKDTTTTSRSQKVETIMKGLTKAQQLIYDAIYSMPYNTAEELAKDTNKSLAQVYKLIAELKNLYLIKGISTLKGASIFITCEGEESLRSIQRDLKQVQVSQQNLSLDKQLTLSEVSQMLINRENKRLETRAKELHKIYTLVS